MASSSNNPASSGTGSKVLMRFEADFKKVPGKLSLTDTHIAWVPNEREAMDRQNQALNRVTNMLASKAGSAKISLKLLFKEDLPAGGLLFTFTNPTTRESDRQAVQDTLIPFVSANRTGAASVSTPSAPTPGIGTPAAGSAGTSTPNVDSPGTPSSVARGKQKAEDMNGGIPKMDPAAKRLINQLRLKVLRKNPTLKLLYQELVLKKQITEEEFWDGREALLQAEELAYAQKPGRPSRLLDDRFDLAGTGKRDPNAIQGGTGVGLKKIETGPIVLNITKELTREIFEEFPVVQDAYAKHVPGISETEFWKRYFTSALWEQHRASVRKSATDEGARRKDDIFDLYLEDPDWNVQPRKPMPDSVEKFLDLSATEEDHGEVSTVRDVTMQAGKERTSLPLIRRFNEHSQKLLRAGRPTAPGETPVTSTADATNTDIYAEIEYEDLKGSAPMATIPLRVDESQLNKEDKRDDLARGILPGRSAEELETIADQETTNIESWSLDFSGVCLPNPLNRRGEDGQQLPPPLPDQNGHAAEQLSKFTYQRDAQQLAMRLVRDLHLMANAEETVYAPLPEQIMEQMRSCHNAATEFLRQYWSAVLPTPPGALGAGTPTQTPAAKATRAARMARYLEGTEGKVNAIVTTAEIARCDPDRVRAAMAPTLGAVAVALKREAARIASTS